MNNANPQLQGTMFADALEEQRRVLWEASAVVESVAHGLEREYGQDWPASVPDFPRALRLASKLILSATAVLDCGELEERAMAIGREEATKEVGHEG